MNKQKTDAYVEKYRSQIVSAKSPEELAFLINKIYEDGFTDGVSSQEEQCSAGTIKCGE